MTVPFWDPDFWDASFWDSDFWQGAGASPEPGPTRVRRRSAMGPLQLAIDAALQASTPFATLIGPRVYSLGTVPKSAVAPYVELGDSVERSAGVFMVGGNANEETLTIVSPKRYGKPGVAVVLAAMVDALEGRTIVLPGHRTLNARLEFIALFPDPDDGNLRGVCRLTVDSWTRPL